jgi:hypothetical protein
MSTYWVSRYVGNKGTAEWGFCYKATGDKDMNMVYVLIRDGIRFGYMFRLGLPPLDLPD